MAILPEPTLIEVSDADGTLELGGPMPPTTAELLLDLMRKRVESYGTPLPDGYVSPPGVDLDALLKQLPPRPDTPPTA